MNHGHRTLGILFGVLLLASFSHALTVSSYNVDPSPLIPGQTFSLYAYITNNTPSSVKNVSFELILGTNSSDTPFPFTIEPTDSLTRSLGTIPPNQVVQVQYQLRLDEGALDGIYGLTLRAFGDNDSGASLTANVQVLARKPILSIIQATPTTLNAGQTATMEITLRNTGSSPAYNLLVGLKEDRTVTASGVVVERTIVPLGAVTEFVSSLNVGETSTLHLPLVVSPDTLSKPYFIPISLEYYDFNKTKFVDTAFLGVKVSGEPILGLILSDAIPLLTPGQKSRVMIDVYNQGLGPAKFVTANVSSEFFSTSNRDSFIGTIESDDFDSIILDGTTLSNVSPGDYPITVSVSYKNEFGDPFTVQKTLTAHVYSPSEVAQDNGGSSPIPLGVGILLIIGLVWWFRFRKPANGNGNGKK